MQEGTMDISVDKICEVIIVMLYIVKMISH